MFVPDRNGPYVDRDDLPRETPPRETRPRSGAETVVPTPKVSSDGSCMAICWANAQGAKVSQTAMPANVIGNRSMAFSPLVVPSPEYNSCLRRNHAHILVVANRFVNTAELQMGARLVYDGVPCMTRCPNSTFASFAGR